jgi:hypothetical protein
VLEDGSVIRSVTARATAVRDAIDTLNIKRRTEAKL